MILLVKKVSLPLLLMGFLYLPLSSYSADDSKTKPTLITKSDARAMLLEKANSDPDIRDDPLMRETYLCALNGPLEEAFGGATVLDAATYERRIKVAVTRMSTDLENKESEATFKMLRCFINSMENNRQRKQSVTENTSPPIPLMDLDDLRTDIASLNGKMVRVKATAYYVMNMLMIKKGSTDMSPMFVDISKVSRDQRRQILKQCNDIMAGCRAIVTGTIDKVSYQLGIAAESIELQ